MNVERKRRKAAERRAAKEAEAKRVLLCANCHTMRHYQDEEAA